MEWPHKGYQNAKHVHGPGGLGRLTNQQIDELEEFYLSFHPQDTKTFTEETQGMKLTI